MPRKAKELSALTVNRLRTPGLYFVGGATGLALQVAESGERTWILRITIGDKRRDMGLGSFTDVTLSMARDKARAARLVVDGGIDPIVQRQQAKSVLISSVSATRTFKECAAGYLEAMAAKWANPKH